MSKFKRVKRIILYVILAIVVVLLIRLIVFLNSDLWRMAMGSQNIEEAMQKEMKYEEKHLTKEQMLKDFDYLFDNLCRNSLVTEYAEQVYKVDYDEIYQRYQERIENCRDEYEFEAIMSSLIAKLPGLHTTIVVPTNKMAREKALQFPMDHEVGYHKVLETNYAFWVQNEARFREYDQKVALAVYYGGSYLFIDYDFGTGFVEDVVGARILKINGEDPGDIVKTLDTYLHWSYDAENDCVFVKNLHFNDGVGEKYTLEIEYEDGTVKEKELYISAEFNMAVYNRQSLYPDIDGRAEDEPDNDASEQPKRERCYEIIKRPEKKMVYIRVKSCNVQDTEAVFMDITEALDEVDAEYVILDNRDNGGGDYTFVTEGVLPALFDHDCGWVNYVHGSKNDVSSAFYSFDKYFGKKGQFREGAEDKGDYFRYCVDLRVHGNSKKSYQIYLLTASTTFSSGDILTAIAKEEDQVLVIGENTKGEGLCGTPITYYLPESKLVFLGCYGVSEKNPFNNTRGTESDIYKSNGWKDMLKLNALNKDPSIKDPKGDFDIRLTWDSVLAYTYDLIGQEAE